MSFVGEKKHHLNDEGDSTDTFSAPPADQMTSMEYFSLFWDDTIMETLVYQSDLYSVQQTGASINLTRSELEQFLGIQMRMSVVKMPSYKLYWSFNCSYDPIASVMSRDRYKSRAGSYMLMTTPKRIRKKTRETDYLKLNQLSLLSGRTVKKLNKRGDTPLMSRSYLQRRSIAA